MDLPPDVLGPVTGAIVVEGRSVRYAVAVRAVARRVELAVRDVVDLGDLTPGAERAFAVDAENTGEMTVEVPEAHRPGDLEVWVRPATVRPGERVALAGRVRVNATQPVRALRAEVPLVGGAAVRVVANVVPSRLPKALAAAAATGGLIAVGSCAGADGSWLGGPLVLAGVVLGLVACIWLFWRDMG
jgi:hypothetical protein